MSVGFHLVDSVFQPLCILLIFYLLVLSINKRRIVLTPTILVDLSIYPFNFISFCSCILRFYYSLSSHLGLVSPLGELTLLYYVIFPVIFLALKHTLLNTNVATLCQDL